MDDETNWDEVKPFPTHIKVVLGILFALIIIGAIL